MKYTLTRFNPFAIRRQQNKNQVAGLMSKDALAMSALSDATVFAVFFVNVIGHIIIMSYLSCEWH